MTIPSKSLLSLLASCSLFCYAYAAIPTTCLSCLPYCWTKPLTHLVLANRCLAMLPLCSAPLIALLVAGEVEDCSMVDRIMLGYHNISYLINASIYLVKGGRLGLMPGVLFHSCRPSFRHTGVMFLDFAFLTRLGDLWDPLDSSLWIKLLQQGPTLVLPFASPPPTLSLGSANPRVIFILAPPGQCLSKCWSELSCLRGHLGETWGLVLLVASLIWVCPENEICAAPIGICRHIRAALLV